MFAHFSKLLGEIGAWAIPMFAGGVSVYIAQRTHIQHLKQRLNDHRIDAYAAALTFMQSLMFDIQRAKSTSNTKEEFSTFLTSKQRDLLQVRTGLIMFASDSVLRQFSAVHETMKARDINRSDHEAKLAWAETLLRDITTLAVLVRREFGKTEISTEKMFFDILGYRHDPHISERNTDQKK